MSKFLSDPFTITVLYFIALIGIGIYSSFRIKNAGDYYIAGKKGNLLQITGSLFATIVGASALLGTFDLSRKEGWPALWFLLCGTLGLFILIPLSKKVSRYGHFTLPELLSLFYGKKAEVAASVIIPVAWTGIIAAQIIAAAKILEGLHLLSYSYAAILTGGIFIIYTLIGGQISVIRTDVFQAILIYAGLLILFIHVAGKGAVQSNLQFIPGKLFTEVFTPFDLLVLFLTYSVTFVVGPDIYSRIFCAASPTIASSSIFITAILLIPVGYIMTYLGIFSVSAEIPLQQQGLVGLGRSILPDWAFGLFIAALLSAVMSSASATLLTSSTILSGLTFGNLAEKKSLSTTRVFIALTGILSIIISLWITSIIESLLFTLSFFSGAFVIPVLAGLLKIRINKKNVLAAILTGGGIALTGKIIQVVSGNIIGNILIISSYLINCILLFPVERKRIKS